MGVRNPVMVHPGAVCVGHSLVRSTLVARRVVAVEVPGSLGVDPEYRRCTPSQEYIAIAS
jgi:hypothetical protein